MVGRTFSGLTGLFLLYDRFYGIRKAWRDCASICKWMKEGRGQAVRQQTRRPAVEYTPEEIYWDIVIERIKVDDCAVTPRILQALR